ncbi:hypothetical protein [Vagococcus silagei]|uniref:Uncharacterized protein n=1 Tax=Vagococcus silagei TaxID=2508885 RepID=A0A4S3B564_9ENTE|nr:hypothetical protein [Vagococcus silagei]THB61638.1 hypothetical protein ESZ54_04080 [Vagococcus silagei]
MEREHFLALKNYFSNEKKFISGGYYRLKQESAHTYKLSFLEMDSCGASIVAPEITVSVTPNEVIATGLIDFSVQPVKQLTNEGSINLELQEELEKLVIKFKKALQ